MNNLVTPTLYHLNEEFSDILKGTDLGNHSLQYSPAAFPTLQ